MTSLQVAEYLGARRSGENRWMAKCPGHEDGRASLSIGTGEDGRVLLNCHAGCSLTVVLMKAGLANRDLFVGPPPTPQQLAAFERQRQAEVVKLRRARNAERLVLEKLRSLGATVNDLGGKLMCNPEDDGLAWLLDSGRQELHDAETFAEKRGIVANEVGRWSDPPPFVDGYNPMEEVARAFGWSRKDQA